MEVLQAPPLSTPTSLMTVGHDGLAGDSSLGLGVLLGTIGVAVGAYHGYKRNNSAGWAVAWALAGGLAPIITVPIALAQGFGKPKR